MMKIVPGSFKFILFALCFLNPFISLNAVNYTDAGTTTTYNLHSGDTLVITSGTYQGYISLFESGAVIIVNPGAVFQPGSIFLPAGKITNYGTTLLGNYGSYGGAAFDNYGILSINGDIMLYDGAVQNWNNHLGANMFVSGSLSINSANLVNDGQLSIGDGFNMYSTNAFVKNTGFMTVTGTMTMSYGSFENLHNLTTGDLDAWSGTLINSGLILPNGSMTVGSGTSYTNNCKQNTGSSFKNYGTTFNNGLILTGKTNSITDEFINSGTFTNSANATELSVGFTNYGSITGSGYYSIAGESFNVGNIGTFRPTADSIIFYDATRTGTNIIDNQWGTLFPNVVFKNFTAPDLTVSYSGCSVYTSNVSALPVVWKYFYLSAIQNKPELEWSAEYEPNMKFTVERSYDQQSFKPVTSIISNNTTVYKFSDNTADLSYPIIYYRILALSTDGSKKYSAIKIFRPASQSSSLSFYPNPASNNINLSFTSNQKQTLDIHIINTGGQLMLSKSMTFEKGSNVIDLDIKNLKPGTYLLNLNNGTNIKSKLNFIKL